jgi:thiol-disulfide isomerase/thioredoxin
MIKVSSRQELDAELKGSKQVLVLFYANWCGYCMRFVPAFEDAIYGLKFEKVISVIMDDYDSPLWDDYDIAAVPTVILFENGKVSKRLDARLGSGLTEERFKAWLDGLKQSMNL